MAMVINATTGYYNPPYSLSPLPPHLRKGLVAVGSLATISLATTLVVLGMVVHRYIIWSKHAEKTSTYNQCIILLSNLLVADVFQALSFSISFTWFWEDGILAPSGYCYAQAGFLNFGDLASGAFVTTMALHTAYLVVKKRSVPQKVFRRSIPGIWFMAFFLTIAGPLAHGSDFYARAGNWVSHSLVLPRHYVHSADMVFRQCWISGKYDLARLLLHYLWIFSFQASTIIIYVSLYIYLRRNSRLAQVHMPFASQNSQVMKAARCMIAYPVVYMVGTLPIAIARMIMYTGKMPSDRYLLWAGCMLTSCGWLDGLLYTITRNVFRDSDNDRVRNASAVSTVGPLSGHKPSHSSTNSTPKRPKLTEWMRTVSTSSVRASLVQVDSVIDPVSECPRQDRFPAVGSPWDHTDSVGPDGRGMSFTDFLNGLDDEEIGGGGGGNDMPLDTIPESPVQPHPDSRF